MAATLVVPMAAPTSAQVVIGPGGLVNVQIVDVIDDINVNVEDVSVPLGVALNIAANVCDVNVNVLAEQLKGGRATCDNLVDGTGQIVSIDQ
jgi:hypothetical protein